MKRPFAQFRPFGPFINARTADADELVPEPPLPTPSQAEIEQTAKVTAAINRIYAIHMMKWLYDDVLPDSERENDSQNEWGGRPLPAPFLEDEYRAFSEVTALIDIETSQVIVGGSAVEGELGYRSPEKIGRTVTQIADEKAGYWFGLRDQAFREGEMDWEQLVDHAPEVTGDNWDSLSEQEQYRRLVAFLDRAFEKFDSATDIYGYDRRRQLIRSYLANMTTSDLDVLFSWSDVRVRRDEEFIDTVFNITEEEIASHFYGYVGSQSAAAPYPPDPIMLDDGSDPPRRLFDEWERVGTPDRSHREVAWSLWKQYSPPEGVNPRDTPFGERVDVSEQEVVTGGPFPLVPFEVFQEEFTM